jgi:RNA polymerase sigma-70 factor, ECF subfamily
MSGEMHSSQDALDVSPARQSAPGVHLADRVATADDLHLVEMLRSGNEAVFVSVVNCYTNTMMRLARLYVPSWAVAEEIVQETWMAVLVSLNRFEGRSSLKTWMFRILINCAKTRAQREGRCVPFSSLLDSDIEAAEPAVEADRFLPADHQLPGHWVSFPSNWEELPEERLLSQETAVCLQQAIEALPPRQRAIITLRDIEGWTAEEACNTLGLSEVNQRVLLHRARSKVRRALEKYLKEE